ASPANTLSLVLTSTFWTTPTTAVATLIWPEQASMRPGATACQRFSGWVSADTPHLVGPTGAIAVIAYSAPAPAIRATTATRAVRRFDMTSGPPAFGECCRVPRQ